MKNKTKNIIRISLALLLVVLIQIMGVTYAKYIAGDKLTGQTEVAKWAFDLRQHGQQTQTIKLADTTNNDTLVNGKIAPGTSGTIYLVADAEGSEVDMEYTLEFINEKNKPDNLIFEYQDKSYFSLEEIGPITGKIKHDDKYRNTVITILWRWPYEIGTGETLITNDTEDTTNANTITEFTFDVVAKAIQSQYK